VRYARIGALVSLLAVTGGQHVWAATARQMYASARAREEVLRTAIEQHRVPPLREFRAVVAAYEGMVRRYPASGYDDNALWQAAGVAASAHERFGQEVDRATVLRLLKWLVSQYPSSPFVSKARVQMERLDAAGPRPQPATPAGVRTATQETALLRNIRRTVLSDRVRISIELDGRVGYRSERAENPPRAVIGLADTRLGPSVPEGTLSYDADSVRHIRIERHADRAVQVVLDLEGIQRYAIGTLENPYRIVVDCEPKRTAFVSGGDRAATDVPAAPRVPASPEPAAPPAVASPPEPAPSASPLRVPAPMETGHAGAVAPKRPPSPRPVPRPAAEAASPELIPSRPVQIAVGSTPVAVGIDPALLRPPLFSRARGAQPGGLAPVVETMVLPAPSGASASRPGQAARTKPERLEKPAETPAAREPATPSSDKPGTPPAARPVPPGDVHSLARQLGLGASKVVVDPGHGGHDPGAAGPGITEADVVLDIALRLENLLREAGLEVVLTRRADEYVPLEERTAIANREQGDLFLSIHANASRNPTAQGVESYYLNFATDGDAEAVAARENAATGRTMTNLPEIVRAIALNSKVEESRVFAGLVERALTSRLGAVDTGLRDHGVKQAPFVVLIGASMPSVLVETAFITNGQEGQLLKTATYRQDIAEALAEAVRGYQRSLKSAQTVIHQ